MVSPKIRSILSLLLLTPSLLATAPAASFNIQEIATITALQGHDPPPVMAAFTVLLPGTTQAWTARLEGNPAPAWVSLSATSGTGSGSLALSFKTAGLAPGSYIASLALISGGTVSRKSFTLNIGGLNLIRMEPDLSRSWIYALHAGAVHDPSYLIPVNTGSGTVGEAIPVGSGATDLAINYQEGKLYINNRGRNVIQVMDLQTRSVLPPLPAEPDIYALNAGRAGRLYAVSWQQYYSFASILNSATGAVVGEKVHLDSGDAEVDPSGRALYFCESGHSGAEITKWDISADTWMPGPGKRPESANSAYGSLNLRMSPDGRRLFWVGLVYDADLQLLRKLGPEIY